MAAEHRGARVNARHVGADHRPPRRPDSARIEVLAIAGQVAGIVQRTIGDRRYRAFLFGSWATGEARERSDIDIGIEGPAPVPPEAMMEIREACEALPTLYTIDLVDLAAVGPRFRAAATSARLEIEAAP